MSPLHIPDLQNSEQEAVERLNRFVSQRLFYERAAKLELASLKDLVSRQQSQQGREATKETLAAIAKAEEALDS